MAQTKLELAIAKLTTAVNNNQNLWLQKLQQWNSEVQSKKTAIDAYIAGARSEQSFTEITKNLEMRLVAGGIDGWVKSISNCSVKHRVLSGILPANRPTDERDLLNYMAGTNDGVWTRYISNPFNIISVKWNNANINDTLTGFQAPSPSQITFGAFILPVSGDCFGPCVQGVDFSKKSWQLGGLNYKGTGASYKGNHMQVKTSSGELLIALAGCSTGYVDLSDPKNWGLLGTKFAQTENY